MNAVSGYPSASGRTRRSTVSRAPFSSIRASLAWAVFLATPAWSASATVVARGCSASFSRSRASMASITALLGMLLTVFPYCPADAGHFAQIMDVLLSRISSFA